jgi:hypothetical protein
VHKEKTAWKQGVVVGDVLTGIDDTPIVNVMQMPPSRIPEIQRKLVSTLQVQQLIQIGKNTDCCFVAFCTWVLTTMIIHPLDPNHQLLADRRFVLNINGSVSNLVAMKEAGVRKAGYMAAFTEGKWKQRYCLLWNGLLMFFKHHTQAVKVGERLPSATIDRCAPRSILSLTTVVSLSALGYQPPDVRVFESGAAQSQGHAGCRNIRASEEGGARDDQW